MSKVALITGITGQDGSYLAELLLGEGYEVHGVVRRSSSFNADRLHHLIGDQPGLHLHYGDLLESGTLTRLIEEVAPDELYNLAAQSHVRVSFDMPVYTADVVHLGTLRLLEAVRAYEKKSIRFYQASSSEMYGHKVKGRLDEDSPFNPRSPYAVAKVAAYHHTRNYREGYGLFVANGILFNHESPRRGETFVTRKITHGLAQIVAGRREHLTLGNLSARRDWGYAGDYVRAIWQILQQDEPDDYVIATGETRSVQEFLDLACALVEREPAEVVRIDPKHFRPTEVDVLEADPSKAKRELGWEPQVSFEQLTAMMLQADLILAGVDVARFPRLRELAPALR